ncbi:C39 family peptidase [Tsukamurella paurometabola]|uniref:C39 family peptidase n=1 Tax=Tsukamurella paurometabola TaxID=2061 RepID=UPI002015E7FD|nr:C39 family peptidase [Tsukamurella paurometabola]
MTEKLLPYDRSIVPQETGFWCGPASSQIALNTRGVQAAEVDLARELGTTVNGTNHVGLIRDLLNRRLPGANYKAIFLENDPPSEAQKNTLWANLVRSIDAGYGVVMNWVAPPSNYPRGVKGSVSPRYGGGVVYHYVTAMGYDDIERAVWIADSGFQPQGYWISFDQCASLIPPKGYAFADVAAPVVQLPVPARASLTAESLSEAMGGALPLDRYRALLPALNDALIQCGCTTVDRAAMWLAQVGHESGGLKWMEEIADGSAYEGRADLGNTQPGDGRRFKGHGPIQITGRYNHAKVSEWAFSKGLVPTPTFFVEQPQQLASDKYGFLGVVWYWTVARDMNSYADRNDILGATRAVNGGTNGLDDRTQRWNRCRAMGDRILPNSGGFLMDDTLYQSLYVDPKTGQRSQFKAKLSDYVLLNDAKVEQMRRDLDYLTQLVEALAVKAGA